MRLTTKGGLISETFSLWFKSEIIGVKSLFWAQSTKREDSHDSDLAPFFWDLSQSEKLSEIKPPLDI